MSVFGLHQPARGNSFFANFALLGLYWRSELDTVPGRSGVLLNICTYYRLLTFADQKTSNTLLLGFYDFPWPHLDNGSIGGSNDNFTNSIRLEGTNITVAGNGANATLENGELTLDPTYWAKTVWYSWVAPFTSRASFMMFPLCWVRFALRR